MKPLGYWIETTSVIYFVRDERDTLPEHKTAIMRPMAGVTITPVYEYKDVAPYVILRDLKRKYNGTSIFYTKWAPQSPYELEKNTSGEIQFEVLDFAEDKEEAVAVCEALRKQREE